MMDEIIKLLSLNLECIDYKLKENLYVFTVRSTKKEVLCPYCNKASSKVHSVYPQNLKYIYNVCLL